jgi:hypothetical protein
MFCKLQKIEKKTAKVKSTQSYLHPSTFLSALRRKDTGLTISAYG